MNALVDLVFLGLVSVTRPSEAQSYKRNERNRRAESQKGFIGRSFASGSVVIPPLWHRHSLSHTSTHARVLSHPLTHAHTHTHALTHTETHTETHTHALWHIQAGLRLFLSSAVRQFVGSFFHYYNHPTTHTCSLSLAHTPMHTHTHAHTHARAQTHFFFTFLPLYLQLTPNYKVPINK